MSAAAETIPFGTPIRLVDGRWRCASLGEMQAVAARPAWANGRPGARASGHVYEPGFDVEARTEHGILMTTPERCRIADGRVVLAGDNAYVELRGGRPIGVEALP